MASLQEIRIAVQGSIGENYFTFFWHCKSVDEHREHGVGFAVKNMILQHGKVESHGNEHITTLCLHTKKGTTTLVSVYVHCTYAIC